MSQWMLDEYNISKAQFETACKAALDLLSQTHATFNELQSTIRHNIAPDSDTIQRVTNSVLVCLLDCCDYADASNHVEKIKLSIENSLVPSKDAMSVLVAEVIENLTSKGLLAERGSVDNVPFYNLLTDKEKKELKEQRRKAEIKEINSKLTDCTITDGTLIASKMITEIAQALGSEGRIALVGKNMIGTEANIIYGGEGLVRYGVTNDFEPSCIKFKNQLIWPNGCIAHIFSSMYPDNLRGPQHHYAWIYKLDEWQNPSQTFNNLLAGLCLGDNPRIIKTD